MSSLVSRDNAMLLTPSHHNRVLSSTSSRSYDTNKGSLELPEAITSPTSSLNSVKILHNIRPSISKEPAVSESHIATHVEALRQNASNVILGATRAAVEGTTNRRMSLLAGDAREKFRQRMAISQAGLETARRDIIRPSKKDETQVGGPTATLTGKKYDKVSPLGDPKTDGNEITFTDGATDIVHKKPGLILGATPAAVEGMRGRRIKKAVIDIMEFIKHYAETPRASVALDGKIVVIPSLIDKTKGHELHGLESEPAYRTLAYTRSLEVVEPDVKPAKRVQWKPEGCMARYAGLYPVPPFIPKLEHISAKPEVQEKPEEAPIAVKPLWCGCCMQESFDPYSLPCGHSFCRRCIVDTNYFLLKDHAAEIKDTRAVMRCPLKCCKAVIPCLPLINGDFRFKLVRPEEKPKLKSELNPCDQYRLKHYRVEIDIDLTNRKSDDLFDGFDDVVVIP